MAERLALGTVQFGLTYGVANQSGRPSREQCREILARAQQSGIDTLDTAIAYGEAEIVLGGAGVEDWKIVTKLPAIPEGCTDIGGWVSTEIAQSLRRLGADRLYGVLLHRPEQLLDARGPELYRALIDLREREVAKKIGVSIYDPAELGALSGVFPLDLVQAPFNLLDRRLADEGWLRRLQMQGVEIHARSAFLQGLLLMEAERLPPGFAEWISVWRYWRQWLDDRGLTPVEACLGYVLGFGEIARVVVGVDHVRQLDEIVAASRTRLRDLPVWPRRPDRRLITPSLWNV
jgi:aryl-alcohol dehydrogenase-like predicted oxidoreductase